MSHWRDIVGSVDKFLPEMANLNEVSRIYRDVLAIRIEIRTRGSGLGFQELRQPNLADGCQLDLPYQLRIVP